MDATKHRESEQESTMSYLPGKFVWFEQSSNDMNKSVAFYSELFGWKAEDMPAGGRPYKVMKNGEHIVAGICEGEQPAWLAYASVEDVDATVKASKKAGAKILQDAFDIPSVGRIAIANEPTGATYALFKAAENDAPDREVGAGDFHWNELVSSNPEKATKYFQMTIPYEHETMEMPGGPYHVLKSQDAPRLGVANKTDSEGKSHFVQYVAVDDCDETLARAEAKGAKRTADPVDVPGVGRFVIFADPCGAQLGIITPADNA